MERPKLDWSTTSRMGWISFWVGGEKQTTVDLGVEVGLQVRELWNHVMLGWGEKSLGHSEMDTALPVTVKPVFSILPE